ncbi:MBL fold metallo-hydrolase [Nocardia crassostreae]|uniref:MBL fold metallo-hydrolase n=1 Tax=Nocardia crassostreae TaxID=53428 RepID=UPI0012F8843B|nr:MBL fold metallo-hydrolase [Nocardia crassostreae]
MLASGLAAAAFLGLTACDSTKGKDAASGSAASSSVPKTGVHLNTLGTEAGPPPSAKSVGISSALVVDGKVYVIDCSRSSVTQFAKAGLAFGDLAGIFLTHLHADHIADYYNYFLLGGWLLQPDAPGFRPVPAYGPGSAGGLPHREGGGSAPVVAPSDPTPGTVTLTNKLTEAYAYSMNIFARDAWLADPNSLMAVHDIELPPVGADWNNTSPTMSPFPVMADDRVKVSATLVRHDDVFPAFAFRFDLDGGKSVTFSGDTVKSDNLITLAHGTDLLVHEAIFDIPAHPEASATPGTMPADYMQRSHTSAREVGEVAQAADAQRLVISHYVPGTPESEWVSRIRSGGYTRDTTVAADLQTFEVK